MSNCTMGYDVMMYCPDANCGYHKAVAEVETEKKEKSLNSHVFRVRSKERRTVMEYYHGRGNHSIQNLEKMVEERNEKIQALEAENKLLNEKYDYQIIVTRNKSLEKENAALKSRLLEFEGMTFSENEEIKALKTENAALMEQSTTRMSRVMELETENEKLWAIRDYYADPKNWSYQGGVMMGFVYIDKTDHEAWDLGQNGEYEHFKGGKLARSVERGGK